MAYQFDPSAWVDGVSGTKPKKSDYVAIQSDIHVAGGNRDGGGYARINTAAVGLIPGAYPGSTYTVTAVAWSAAVATFTVGAHLIALNQLITITGVTPTGYNVASAKVTGITGTTFSIALTTNPGVWSSGGSLLVGTVPGVGTIASGPFGGINVYNGSAWSSPSAGQPRASAIASAGVVIPTGGLPYQSIGLDADVITPIGITRTGSVFTVLTSGLYAVCGCVAYNANATSNRYARWFVNGVMQPYLAAAGGSVDGSFITAIPVFFTLTAGQTVELKTVQTSGVSLSTYASLSSVSIFQLA